MADKKLKFLIINNYSQFASKDVWSGMVHAVKDIHNNDIIAYAVDAMQAFFSSDIQQHHIVSTAVSTRNNITHVVFIGSAFIEPWTIETIQRCGIKIIYWSLEDPHAFDQNSRFMELVDYYFTNERAVANKFDKAYYLPTAGAHTACVPAPFPLSEAGEDEQKIFNNDVVFCGNVYPNRKEILEPIIPMFEKHKIKLGIMGVVAKLDDEGKSRIRDYLIPGFEGIVDHRYFIAMYAYSKFVINIERDSTYEYNTQFSSNQKYKIIGESLNPRAYEIALTGGGLQLIDEKRIEIFDKGILEPNKHCIVYKSPDDMVNKIRYYLKHEGERKKIVDAAREHALKNHTYACRADRMINIINWLEGRKEKVMGEALSKLFSGKNVTTK